MDYAKESLRLHAQWNGKIETKVKVPLETKEDLALAYTPGVAAACMAIHEDYQKSFQLTSRANTIAVVTDGTAVLGLGDIGPEAGMPVMEGKCALFKAYADVNAIPICIRTKDVDEIVKTISLISGTFGGIHLEDIGAPRCFEVEKRLKELCDVPIFHDDQHGTAIVTAAALINARRLVNKQAEDMKIVINGAGAAGVAIGKLLVNIGFKNIIMCDREGAIHKNREHLSQDKLDICSFSNPNQEVGTLADVLCGSDVFIGVSAGNIVSAQMIKTMNDKAIVFAMANPIPEIMPEEAKAGGAYIVGTGRSDFENQINNVLAFPGVFKGALDVFAKDINEEMKIAAAYAIANLITDEELKPSYIIPDAMDQRVAKAVAKAVAEAAIQTKVARI